jgi:uncharacterized membrane protein
MRMTTRSWRQIVALGAITGMRSMAGPAALARARGGGSVPATMALAVGEMIADKLPTAGDRVAPLPLIGRATIGAVIGAIVAHDHDGDMLAGGLLGAATAVVAAELAFHVRRRLPVPNLLAGLLEDALVVGIASLVARQASEASEASE